jgi:hypothetical protein
MKTQTRASAIKTKCLECAGSSKEVILCDSISCPLYSYRFGFNPNSKRYKKKIERGIRSWPEVAKEIGLE